MNMVSTDLGVGSHFRVTADVVYRLNVVLPDNWQR